MGTKGDKRKMTKEQEFRKQTEEAKFEAFSLMCKKVADLEKENAELKSIAEFQQSSNMNTHLENKKLKEGLAVGSMWNKHLNSQNKALEEERDRYREMTFDMKDQLTKAKKIIKDLLGSENTCCEEEMFFEIRQKAENFLKDSEVEK